MPVLILFDTHCRVALERTFAQAQRLEAHTIGREHVLLGVLAVDSGKGFWPA